MDAVVSLWDGYDVPVLVLEQGDVSLRSLLYRASSHDLMTMAERMDYALLRKVGHVDRDRQWRVENGTAMGHE